MAHLEIDGGPSKWDIMLALFDRLPCTPARTVTFTIKEVDGSDRRKIEMFVTAIEARDGSGESWDLQLGSAGCLSLALGDEKRCQIYSATYSTLQRKGTIRIP